MRFDSETFVEMRRIAGFLKPRWKTILLVFLFSGMHASGVSVRAYILKPVVDQLTEPNLTEVWRIFWVVAASAMVMSVSSLFKEYLDRRLTYRILADIRCDIASHLLTLSMRFFNNQRVGELMSKMTNDIDAIKNGLRFLTSDVIQMPITLLALAVTGFVISWKLSLFTFLILPVLFVSIMFFGKRIRSSSKKGLGKLADVTEAMQQFMTGIKIVKAFRREKYEEERFREINESHFRKMLRVAKAKSSSIAVNELLYNFGAALLVLGGMVLVTEYALVSVPELVAFMAVVFSMYQPTKALSKAYGMIQESVAGAGRVFGLMTLKPDISDSPGAVDMPSAAEVISFRNVTFSYGEEPVLRGVEYSARRGQVTALVGESGAGKTTFIDLLLRLYDPAEGAIEIDGVDIRRIKIKSLLDSMAIVTQDPFLFNASIRENIRYGRLDASEEDIRAAAAAAYIGDFIEKEVEGGYDAVVGERGVKLSGGQRQRITIARAIIRNPKILLLDEATAALDSESETHVQMALNNLMQGRTTFAVAHRLSTIINADCILVFDSGRIVERGKHEQLLALGGAYARLYYMQYSKQENPASALPDAPARRGE